MSTLWQLRGSWILRVTTIVLACFGNAFSQVSYRVTDLGVNKNSDNFNMVMGLNNLGWAENMDGVLTPPIRSTSTTILSGRAVISIYGLNIDLGTLGGDNSWTNYGGINDLGEAVGMSETSVPDPDGEDMCAFHTKRTCRPFLWRDGHMHALPTLGGNNGQASAINNHEQIVGISETTAQDPGCSPSKPGHIISPVFWKRGEVRALPTVAGDPDGFVQGMNDRGHAVGSSGTCTSMATHAVLWKNDTAFQLADLGQDGNAAYAINDHDQVVGYVSSGTTIVAALWQNGAHGAVTNLGILPGDGAAFATGINNRRQVVGSTFSSIGWTRGFIWQDDVMTDLNTLIRKDSNLLIIAASNINERGQISGMAMVQAGPNAGKIHAILLTPVNERIGRSMADDEATRPTSNAPAKVDKQLLQRLGISRVE